MNELLELSSASKMMLSRSWNGVTSNNNGAGTNGHGGAHGSVVSASAASGSTYGKRLSLDDIQPLLSPGRYHNRLNRLILPLGYVYVICFFAINYA